MARARAEERAAATWWLCRRFELDAMAKRLDALAFDAVGHGEWRLRLDGARTSLAAAVRLADERAAAYVPDELERRELREQLRVDLLQATGARHGG